MVRQRSSIATFDRCGRRYRCPDVARAYRRLADEDERAGLQLQKADLLRPALYHFCQAGEKYARAVLCTRVDPTSSDYRVRHHHHAVDRFLAQLIDQLPGHEPARAEMLALLQEHVLGYLRFEELHNELRYPFLPSGSDTYTLLEVTPWDADELYGRLCLIKKFLHDYERLA